LISSNYPLINDDASVIPNRPDYDDHRHEQSVMSLLLKKREFYPIPKEITLESVICTLGKSLRKLRKLQKLQDDPEQ